MRVGWVVLVGGCASGTRLGPPPVFGPPIRAELAGCTWSQGARDPDATLVEESAVGSTASETTWDRLGRPVSEWSVELLASQWSTSDRRTDTSWTWVGSCPVHEHTERTSVLSWAPEPFTDVSDVDTTCDDQDQPVRSDTRFDDYPVRTTTWANTYDGDDLVRSVSDGVTIDYRWDHHRLVGRVTTGPNPLSDEDVVVSWTAEWRDGKLHATRSDSTGLPSMAGPSVTWTRERYDPDGYWLGTDSWTDDDEGPTQQRWSYGPGDGLPSARTTTAPDGEILDEQDISVACP